MVNLAHIVFGVLTILAAAGVVGFKKPLNSALCLVLTLFLVAVHFAMLDAHLLATLQILIYAGAIMVLVIFVIMLLGIETEEISSKKERVLGGAAFLLAASFMVLCTLSISGLADFSIVKGLGIASGAETISSDLSDGFGSTKAVGELMFTRYILPFQLVGLLLLAAIIGSVLLAQDSKRPLPAGRGLKDKQGS